MEYGKKKMYGGGMTKKKMMDGGMTGKKTYTVDGEKVSASSKQDALKKAAAQGKKSLGQRKAGGMIEKMKDGGMARKKMEMPTPAGKMKPAKPGSGTGKMKPAKPAGKMKPVPLPGFAGKMKPAKPGSAGQMKKFPKAAKNPNSRLRQARKRWKC